MDETREHISNHSWLREGTFDSSTFSKEVVAQFSATSVEDHDEEAKEAEEEEEEGKEGEEEEDKLEENEEDAISVSPSVVPSCREEEEEEG